MDDLKVVDLKDLRVLGIKYSRTHLKRRMFEERNFPVWFSLDPKKPKSRKVWWLRDIRSWLIERSGQTV